MNDSVERLLRVVQNLKLMDSLSLKMFHLIFSGYPQITETAVTELVDTGFPLYIHSQSSLIYDRLVHTVAAGPKTGKNKGGCPSQRPLQSQQQTWGEAS